MRKLLCFGDSNTYGYAPYDGRYGEDIRWTGRLATALSGRWQVIEAGLNGRTVGHYDEIWPALNGVDVITAKLQQHQPDLVIVMLGSNDALYTLADDIAADMGRLLALIPQPILLIAPVPFAAEPSPQRTSALLAPLYEQLAAAEPRISFADAGNWGVELSEDGCHFSAAGHRRFAERLAQLIPE